MKRKHIILWIGFILFALAGLSHAVIFPQETRCMLVSFYDFEKEGNLYYRSSTDQKKVMELKHLILQAEKRVDSFWGQKTAAPTFIYCENDEDYKKFGTPFMTPASAHFKLDSYVIITKDGIDLDILAHEISHTELKERIGFFNRLSKIPVWFDEGLAMQVDYRDYYSIDTLKKQSQNFQNLPDVTKMTTYPQFGSGTHKEVMMNYSTAKYEVFKWYSDDKLTSFIEKINECGSFSEAYYQD